METVRRLLPLRALGRPCPDCRTPLKRGGHGGRRRATAKLVERGRRLYCLACAAERSRDRARTALRHLGSGPAGRAVTPAAVQTGRSTWWRAALTIDSLGSESRRERRVGPRLYRTSSEALARARRWARSLGRGA